MPLLATAQAAGLYVGTSLVVLLFGVVASRGGWWLDMELAKTYDYILGLRAFSSLTTTNYALFALLVGLALAIRAVDAAWERVNRRLAKAVGTDLELVSGSGDGSMAGSGGLDLALRTAGVNSWALPQQSGQPANQGGQQQQQPPPAKHHGRQ